MTDILTQIGNLENEIMEKKKLLAELRKAVPEKQVKNYEFITSTEEKVTLLDLFGEKDELIVIHNMGKSCSYCTMWADGFNGVYHHLIAKAGFVVASPNSPQVQADFAADRQWKFPMISVKDSTFTDDMGFKRYSYFHPGVSTFRKDEEGNIFLHTQAQFGPGDDYCVPWHLFDLLPSGSENVQTKQKLNNNSQYQLTNNIAFGVNDYEKAVHFYEDVLGMKREQSFEDETKFSISGVHFYIEDNEENKVAFEFSVEDFEKAKEQLLNNNCKIAKENSKTSVMVKDPFGLYFHLFQGK